MIEAKIRLSEVEMELVMNAEWILTKNRIMEKAKELLEGLQAEMVSHLGSKYPGKNLQQVFGHPKISKGENYKGLPYLILDYPRIFHKENTFAIRTLFWWGNFFSTTLHLSGVRKIHTESKISSAFEELQRNDFFVCVNEEEWEHHFGDSNYAALTGMTSRSFHEQIKEKAFLKIAKRLPLQDWNEARTKLLRNFTLLIAVINLSYPAGEKAL